MAERLNLALKGPPCCHKCAEGVTDKYSGIAWTSMWMVLCPECGNKRCPKASDHRLACTNSNEPGQPGSVYGGSPDSAS